MAGRLTESNLYDPAPGSIHVVDIIQDASLRLRPVSDQVFGMLVMANREMIATKALLREFKGTFLRGLHPRKNRTHSGHPFIGPDGLVANYRGVRYDGSNSSLDGSPLNATDMEQHPNYKAWLSTFLSCGQKRYDSNHAAATGAGFAVSAPGTPSSAPIAKSTAAVKRRATSAFPDSDTESDVPTVNTSPTSSVNTAWSDSKGENVANASVAYADNADHSTTTPTKKRKIKDEPNSTVNFPPPDFGSVGTASAFGSPKIEAQPNLFAVASAPFEDGFLDVRAASPIFHDGLPRYGPDDLFPSLAIETDENANETTFDDSQSSSWNLFEPTASWNVHTEEDDDGDTVADDHTPWLVFSLAGVDSRFDFSLE